MIEVRAKLKYLRIAPKKVRPVANVIKHMSVERAEAELGARSKRASGPMLKLLRSAVANAKNVYHLDKSSLSVKNVLVDPGPSLKRILPRAHGKADPILKRMSHVTIILASKEVKAQMAEKVRLPESEAGKVSPVEAEEGILKKPEAHPKIASKMDDKRAKGRRGFTQRVFRRKAI